MEKDRWIDEVLNSTQHIKRTKLKRDLFPIIEERLVLRETRVFGMSKSAMMAAASVLLVINAISIYYFNAENSNLRNDGSSVLSYQEISIIDYSGY